MTTDAVTMSTTTDSSAATVTTIRTGAIMRVPAVTAHVAHADRAECNLRVQFQILPGMAAYRAAIFADYIGEKVVTNRSGTFSASLS